MEVFTVIDGAVCILRLPKGVFKQSELYHRGKRLYVKHGSGFVEVRSKDAHGGEHSTSHPDVKLIEWDATSFEWHVEKGIGEILRYGSKQ